MLRCLEAQSTQQSLAADGAIARLSSSFFRLSSDAARAPQLKASVRRLRPFNRNEDNPTITRNV
jgi:hypothetical protein